MPKLELVKLASPMTPFEHKRFSAYLEVSGMKKGAFVRQAILEKLDRDEHILTLAREGGR